MKRGCRTLLLNEMLMGAESRYKQRPEKSGYDNGIVESTLHLIPFRFV